MTTQTTCMRAGLAKLPASACDCHMHIFGMSACYPMAPERSYTPPQKSVADYRAMATAVGLQRAVVVQPSTYGADNRCLVAALQEFGGDARGVAVIDDTHGEAALDALDRAGIRGVRINAISNGRADEAFMARELRRVAGLIRDLKWHVQIFADLQQIAALAGTLESLPVPVIVDHFGLAKAAAGTNQPGFRALLDLVGGGNVWVKLSGADRISSAEPGYEDAAPLVTALVAAGRERLLWGSDWPHTPKHAHASTATPPFLDCRAIDDRRLVAQFLRWVGDEAVIRQILVDNPARLYGFPRSKSTTAPSEALNRLRR